MSQLDDIVGRMRASIQSTAALMEGSFTMDNLRAVGQEFLLCYLAIQRLQDNWSLDTATGGFLDKKALDYGLDRKGADYARGLVRFSGAEGAVVPYGTLIGDKFGMTYKTMADATIGKNGSTEVLCQAQATGLAGNIEAGSMTGLLEPIPGVTACENLEAFSDGREEESDLAFRQRIYEKIRNPITSGNVNSYRQWALSFDNVGAVKVFPLWRGPGTVKLSILDAQRKPAGADLMQGVKNYIDPEDGDGSGQAPIGAILTVTTAKAVKVNVTAKVQVGVASSLTGIQDKFKAVLEEYFYKIAYDEITTEFTLARCGYLLLGISGVFDYTDLKINGGTNTIATGDEEVLQVGSISLTAR
ncbi:MAG: baseplate J/gp47 family protein [Clostridia bacterium]|nr:baseplate J/gp47 family protein [Clostridiales bacterium]MDU7504561.1 baseplate J/gp47 family protein [Clostridia bacterium]